MKEDTEQIVDNLLYENEFMNSDFVEASTVQQPQNNDDPFQRFRQIVKQLVQIDNSIRDMNAELKILRSKRNELKQQVSAFMQNRNIEQLNLPDGGKMTINRTERKLNMYTKKRITNGVVDYFTRVENLSHQEATKKEKDICQYIESIAPTVTTSNIRRLRK